MTKAHEQVEAASVVRFNNGVDSQEEGTVGQGYEDLDVVTFRTNNLHQKL